MVLSIRSQGFQDAYKKFNEEYDAGNLRTKEEQDNFFAARDMGIAEFGKAADEYEDALSKGEVDFTGRGTFLTRVPGRAVGDMVTGIVDLVDMVTPGDLSGAMASAMDNAPIPDSAKEIINELFDPYHGDETGGMIEKGAAFLGSLAVPSTALIKGLNLANKGAKLASPAARASIRQAAKKIDKDKRRQFLEDEYEKAIRLKQLAQTGAQGAVYAGVGTVVEDPEQGLANTLVELFPESEKYLERLVVNPDDSEAENFIKRLMTNMGFSAALSPLYLAHAFKKPILTTAAIPFQPIGKAMSSVAQATGLDKLSLPATFSSRMGTDDVAVALTVEKEAAVDATYKVAQATVQKYNNDILNYAKEQAEITGRNFSEIEEELKGSISAFMNKGEELKDLEFDKFITRYGEELASKYESEYLAKFKQPDPSLGFTKGQKIKAPPATAKGKQQKGTILSVDGDTAVVSVKRYDGKRIKRTVKIDDLELDIKDEIIKDARQFASQKVDEDAMKFAGNKARNFIKTNISQLPKDVQETVKMMRKDMDNMSTELNKASKGKFSATVGNNLGVYLTRQYSVFDDPVYRKQILNKYKKFKKDGTDENGVFATALNEIKKMGTEEYPIDDSNAIKYLDEMLKSTSSAEANSIFETFIAHSTKTGSAKSGLARKKLPEGLSVLYKPMTNFENRYVGTMANLSKATATTRYLSELADHMIETGVAVREPGLANINNTLGTIGKSEIAKVLGTSEDIFNPIQGLYTDNQNYINLLKEGINSVKPTSGIMKAFLAGKGLSQSMKTIFSPITWGRNVAGNIFFMLANGMGLSRLGEGFRSAKTNFLNKNSREQAERYALYVRLGLVNSGLNVNQIRRNMTEAVKDTDNWIANLYDKGANLSFNKKMVDFYQAQDDMFKIAHFEETLAKLKRSKAFKGKSEEEIIREAAQRTRDLLPNYKLVPKAVKNLGGSVVGDFVSFPAEVLRVSKNLAKYTYKDLVSGDPALQAMAAKRLAGMTAVGIGGDMLSDFSRNMSGITDEQEAAINNRVPSWEYNQDRIYLSGLKKDRNNHTVTDYFNLGPIDPFAYIKTMSKGVHAAILAGMDENTANQHWDKIAAKTFLSSVEPFLAPSMITETIMDTVGKVKEDGVSYETALEPAVELFTPGFWNQWQKVTAYGNSKKKQDVYAQDPYKKGYATYYDGEVDVPAALGLKRQRLDLTAGVPFALDPIINEIKGLPTEMTRKISDPSITDPNEVYDTYKSLQKKKLNNMEQLRFMMKDYKALFGDNYLTEVGYGLSRMGSKDIDSVARTLIQQAEGNVFEPFTYTLTPQIMELSRTPIPYDEINNLTNQLMGTAIVEDEEED
jgi:hypothetical protein